MLTGAALGHGQQLSTKALNFNFFDLLFGLAPARPYGLTYQVSGSAYGPAIRRLPANVTGLDQNIREPIPWHWSFGVQQEAYPNTRCGGILRRQPWRKTSSRRGNRWRRTELVAYCRSSPNQISPKFGQIRRFGNLSIQITMTLQARLAASVSHRRRRRQLNLGAPKNSTTRELLTGAF